MSARRTAMPERRLPRCAVALAVALAVTVLPGRAEASGELGAVEVNRHGGTDRYATSLTVAEEIARLEGGRLEWVVLVAGSSWTDAVVAAPLAGQLGAPVLVTPSHALRADAAEFLAQVGVSKAIVIGTSSDTAGIGAGVVAGLRGLGIVVERISGADQYETSAAVAWRIGAPNYLDWARRGAILASGEVFADALVAGVIGARGPIPILLTPPDRLHPAVAHYLQTVQGQFDSGGSTTGVRQVLLMGGTAALSDDVQQAVALLRNASGEAIEAIRVVGDDRFHTAVLAASWATKVGSHSDTAHYRSVSAGRCGSERAFGMARGDVPFDALSAAPLLARLCAPLLLTLRDRTVTRVGSLVDNARGLAAYGWAPLDLRVFGGDAAVPQRTVDLYLGTRTAADTAPSVTCDIEPSDEPLPLADGANVRSASWSPDCSRIAFAIFGGGLWTARLDGSDLRQLTLGYKQRPRGALMAGGAFAVWSPDGSKIAFRRLVREPDGTFGDQSHIWVMDADGRGARQLTFGNVADTEPSWSPDGSQIAFERTDLDTPEHFFQGFADRFTAVMDADGSDIVELSRGGRADDDPEWSPDGRHIAYSYAAGQDLHIMQANGALTREVPLRHDRPSSGFSWSPDGQWLALIEAETIDGDFWQFVTITSLDGTRRQRIVSFNRSALSNPGNAYVQQPRWSPDGRFILYVQHTWEPGRPDADERFYIAEAVEPAAVEFSRECVLPKQFPRVGIHRAAVLFVDFPDVPAEFSTQEHAVWTYSNGTVHDQFKITADYAEATSYDKLDVEFVPLHGWLRLGEPFEHYSRFGTVTSEAAEAAVELARSELGFDFSDIDSIVMVLPGSRFVHGQMTNTGLLGRVTPLAVINTTLTGGVAPVPYLSSFTHEFMHILGFGDLYNARVLGSFDTQTVRPRLDPDQGWRELRIGVMGLRVQYPAPKQIRHTSQRYETLGWHRWRAGWIDSAQVVCVTDTPATVELAPIHDPDGRTALAVVRATPEAHIYIESRRRTAADTPTRDHDTAGDAVLVYVEDVHTPGGIIQLATDNGYGYLGNDPLLELGDSLTVHGHTITVTADHGDTHTVTITKGE